MKKRILCFFLAMLMLVLMPACQETPDPNEQDTTDTSDATTGGEPGPTEEPATPVYIGNNKKAHYAIVLAQTLPSAASDLAATLRTEIQKVVGAKPNRNYDNTDINPEVDKEILIGLTNREETTEVKNKLAADEYMIELVGDKIVVLGANDTALCAAINELMTVWTAADGAISVPSNLSVKKKLSDPMLKLLDGDKFAFKIIRGASSSADIGADASDLRDDLEALFGDDKINCTLDTTVPADSKNFEILVGMTNRPESAEAFKNLNALGYRIAVIGNKITVAASSDDQYSQALNALFIIIRNAKNGTIVGTPSLSTTLSSASYSSVMGQSWFLTIPTLTDGNLIDGYAGDSASCILERENATVEGFDAYVKQLEAAGFTGGEDYELGDNRYALRYGEKATVYVSYSAKNESIRLYAEVAGTFKYPAKDQKGTVNTYEPKLWQLRVDNINSRANGGMSYVWLLADGTFFVIDGGYNTPLEAENLCKFLAEKNPRQGKPVVSAWYFSHTHGDHIGAIQAVAANYASAIDVKAFYYHFENSIPSGFRNATAAWSGAKHYARLHTGMQIELPGITVNVIYTLEDQYSKYPETGNDYSAVIRVDVTAGGTTQRVMFLGDIQLMASNRLMKYIGNDILKSDIVQYSHHGYEGATRQLYNAIAAPTVLWPMNYVSTQESYGSVCNVFAKWYLKNSGGEGFMPNQYMSTSASYCKQIIVAGGSASQEITFPYTPKPYTNAQSGTNGRLPDLNTEYRRVYAELLPNGYDF